MRKKGQHGTTTRALRLKAEKRLAEGESGTSGMEGRDLIALVHELQVHQIELEMQNEELRRARWEADGLRQKYQDLYDFAPVGYVTLGANGTVRETNDTAAFRLGIPRKRLIAVPFVSFLDVSSVPAFRDFMRRALAAGTRQSCEVVLVGRDGATRHILIEGTAVPAPEGKGLEVRAALVDISERRDMEERITTLNDELVLKAEALATVNREEGIPTLRRRAETKLAAEGELTADAAERDPIALIHELQVHQIELELQNVELQRSQQEAEDLREKYQDLYDFAPVGYVTLDTKGTVREANLTAAVLLGCDRHRLVGRPLFFFLAPESRDGYDHFLRRLLAGAAGARYEARLGANAKRQGWLLFDGGTFVDGGGKRQPGRLALMDVTDRKMAEESLRKSEEKFSRIFHVAPVLIGISTLEDERYIDLNAAGLQKLGYSRDELIGRTAHELNLWADPADRTRMVQIVEEQGSVRNFEMRFRDKAGRIHNGLFSAELIDLDGERYLLSVVRDVTERKQAEEKIEHLNTELAARAAELEAANLELEAFNYSVSHDLRNPLTAIGGYCEVIQEFCANELNERCRGYLREINAGVKRMDQFIDTLLNFSRLSHAKPERKAVDLTAMAQAVAAELRLAHPERSVVFRIAEGITVDGDPKLLWLVMENLLGNAWKYTNERNVALIEVGTADVEGKPACFVRDNGTGFDMVDADKLFTPFQRLPGAEEFKGHGIGLATVQRIIQRHGGRIWAEGTPGEGATFYFTL